MLPSHFTPSTNGSLPKITIVGAAGFIGSNLSKFFKKLGYEVAEIYKNYQILPQENYGIVFYCAGVSIDFQGRIFDTLDAHVMQLRDWLERAQFDKFIYISSTRMYIGQEDTSENRDFFIMDKNDIYNQTKMMGELACLFSKRPVIVLRVSNVVGYDEISPYFLWNVFRQAKQNKNIKIQESKLSVRDYLYLDDLLSIAYKITTHSIEGIYNVASSINTSHLSLENIINKQHPCKWSYGEKTIALPVICTKKIEKDLAFQFSNPSNFIDKLFNQYMIGRYNDEK